MANLQGMPGRSLQGLYKSLQGYGGEVADIPAVFTNIATSPDNIFVTERNKDRVLVFDYDGNYVDYWGGSGTGDGQFDFYDASSQPFNYIFYYENEIYVLDKTRMQVFSTDGVFSRKIEKRGMNCFIENDIIYWTTSAGAQVTHSIKRNSTADLSAISDLSLTYSGLNQFIVQFLYVTSTSIYVAYGVTTGTYIEFPVSGGTSSGLMTVVGRGALGAKIYSGYVFVFVKYGAYIIRRDFRSYTFPDDSFLYVSTPTSHHDIAFNSSKLYSVRGNTISRYSLDLEYEDGWSYSY